MKIIGLLTLSVLCTASNTQEVAFLGAKPIHIDKASVQGIRRAGSIGGYYITSVTLKGVPETGTITLRDPGANSQRRIAALITPSCESTASHEVDSTAFRDIPVDPSVYRDYVGPKYLDVSWNYWVAYSPAYCGAVGPKVALVCAGSKAQYRCVRELLKENYSAYFLIDAEKVRRWQDMDLLANEYLSRVVK